MVRIPAAPPSKQLDAIAQMSSGVAHDVNVLLTAIRARADGLATDVKLLKRHRDELAAITRDSSRAAELTQKLLAFSQKQIDVPPPLDVNELITGMLAALAKLTGRHIDIALDLTPNLASALAYRAPVRHVVISIIDNARDAMPAGGNITISTENVELEDSPFQQEAIRPGHYVMFSITDTGSGMSRETQRRLFEPLFTTKDNGNTGLGLSLAYGMVRQNNGYIGVSSEPGRGSTFKVYLPRSNDPAPVAVHTEAVSS